MSLDCDDGVSQGTVPGRQTDNTVSCLGPEAHCMCHKAQLGLTQLQLRLQEPGKR